MGGTLLLADDSITIQKVVELTFAETEHTVVTVGSGRDLFGRLAEVKPDVVLCDVVMPDMNGYEVCQTLKSDPNTLHLPVVLLTGTFEPFDRDRAVAAGCDAIVTKPFEARELINVVEDLLKRAQSFAALPMPGEAGSLGDQGIPDGVPALDFSTTGFDQLASRIPAPLPPPEEGIELTSSSLGDSRPSAPMPAPPELAEPEVPMAVSAVSQSFAFGGDEAEAAPEPPRAETPPAREAFAEVELPTIEEDNSFATMRVPAPDTPVAGSEPAPFAPEPATFAPEPPAPAPATFATAEPFVAPAQQVESAHDLFAPDPEPAPVPFAAPRAEPVEVSAAPAFDEGPTQRFPVEPEPPVEPPTPEPALLAREYVETLPAAVAPLAAGVVAAEAVEHIAQRVKAMIPEALSAPPAAIAAPMLTDEHVERIAKRAAELVPQPPAPAAAPAELSEEAVEKLAKKVIELSMPQLERIAKRAAELVPPPPAPAAAPAELSEEAVEKIAKKVVELSLPQLERIAWEVIPDMAEMIVRKRIAELEKAAEDEA